MSKDAFELREVLEIRTSSLLVKKLEYREFFILRSGGEKTKFACMGRSLCSALCIGSYETLQPERRSGISGGSTRRSSFLFTLEVSRRLEERASPGLSRLDYELALTASPRKNRRCCLSYGVHQIKNTALWSENAR